MKAPCLNKRTISWRALPLTLVFSAASRSSGATASRSNTSSACLPPATRLTYSCVSIRGSNRTMFERASSTRDDSLGTNASNSPSDLLAREAARRCLHRSIGDQHPRPRRPRNRVGRRLASGSWRPRDPRARHPTSAVRGYPRQGLRRTGHVRGIPHRGILRLVDIRAADHGLAAVAAIDAHGAVLAQGAIVTVEPGRVRVRPPESSND